MAVLSMLHGALYTDYRLAAGSASKPGVFRAPTYI
jgi:hypothetical protein